jgi:hypothetical protein
MFGDSNHLHNTGFSVRQEGAIAATVVLSPR